MKTPSPADSDTLVQDAAHWCMRLHAEDLSEEERGEFQRWLAADPRHAAEYAEMEEIWALSELLPRTPAPELRNHAATRPLGRRRRGWKSQARAATLALLMLPTAGYLGWLQGWIPPTTSATRPRATSGMPFFPTAARSNWTSIRS